MRRHRLIFVIAAVLLTNFLLSACAAGETQEGETIRPEHRRSNVVVSEVFSAENQSPYGFDDPGVIIANTREELDDVLSDTCWSVLSESDKRTVRSRTYEFNEEYFRDRALIFVCLKDSSTYNYRLCSLSRKGDGLAFLYFDLDAEDAVSQDIVCDLFIIAVPAGETDRLSRVEIIYHIFRDGEYFEALT